MNSRILYHGAVYREAVTPEPRLLEVWDVRPFDWETGKRVPFADMDQQDLQNCDRCGRFHAEIWRIAGADGQVYEVGKGCAQRLFGGWVPTPEELQQKRRESGYRDKQKADAERAQFIQTTVDALTPILLAIQQEIAQKEPVATLEGDGYVEWTLGTEYVWILNRLNTSAHQIKQDLQRKAFGTARIQVTKEYLAVQNLHLGPDDLRDLTNDILNSLSKVMQS